MQHRWFKRDGNSSLLIFFTGWGMDLNSTGHLLLNDHDLLVFYSYSTIDNFPLKETETYSDITVIAFSMGVWAASLVMQQTDLKVGCTIAINGTAMPVSDMYGIPVEIYNNTCSLLTENSFKKFLHRVCGNKNHYEQFATNMAPVDIKQLQKELRFIQTMQLKIHTFRPWDLAILGKNDLIFPFVNSKLYWEKSNTLIEVIDAPHYPFFIWQSWDNIVQLINK